MAVNNADAITYEQFRDEWVADIEAEGLTPLEKGRLFGAKLVSQWLGVTTEDDDFFICDGGGDGGIDIAYLQRADDDNRSDVSNAIEGDTWYIVQSKYGSAFSGADTIAAEGNKVVSTLQGNRHNLSDDARQLMQKLDTFRKQSTDADRITLVFATTDPIPQKDRSALDNIKRLARGQISANFDVEEVSVKTIWEMQEDVETARLSVPVKGNFVKQSSNLLVGTVSLMELFDFLKAYQNRTGNLDQLYEKNVRQFLGNRRKINKGIAETLNKNPDKFGLYNNGITIVVSSFDQQSPLDGAVSAVTMRDPYVVNGCQTTRTIWEVMDVKLRAGGSGQDDATEEWKELASRGGVVTKIVSSDANEILNITRYTNSQNSVREQDFIALNTGFQDWANEMEREYDIFLEIQRGGTDARKAREKQHPESQPSATDYVNAFDLIKVYGAGWIGVPGLAFNKNAPFLPNHEIYDKIMNRQDPDPAFGTRDLYAAYKLKCIADEIGFGRRADRASRRQSRFLFYFIFIRMLSNVILLTPEFTNPPVSASDLTNAVIKLTDTEAETELSFLRNAAVAVLDQYLMLDVANPNSAHNERSFSEIHNGDLNGFLKSEKLGEEGHSPLLVQSLAQYNLTFSSVPLPMYEGNPTQREFVARALLGD